VRGGGGPQIYTGRDMAASHQHLKITAGEWQAFMEDLTQTLDKFDVPATERAEIETLVESTHAAIVTG
jgi:hemoglobin